ncbi:MAG: metallophosphoesterase family protein [Rhodospirillales bacterium]
MGSTQPNNGGPSAGRDADRGADPDAKPGPHAPRVPRGTRVYAIGDIHGRLDLLDALHAAIGKDAEAAAEKSPRARRRILIHLGDYVDRGPDSKGVIERLAGLDMPGFEVVNLKGNHEDFFVRFMAESSGHASTFDVWQANGAPETLKSYGIAVSSEPHEVEEIDRIRRETREKVPAAHKRFLKNLVLRKTVGDYLFVHAGINPAFPLSRQRIGDLLWIRGRFLDHPGPFGKVIVHGHTIFSTPEVLDHRIGIDTGAYYSHRLTCLVLAGTERYFLRT